MHLALSGTRTHSLLSAAIAVMLITTAFLAGVATGRVSDNLHPVAGTENEDTYANGFKDGFASAHEKLLQSGLLPRQALEPITSLTGTVTAINGNVLHVVLLNIPRDPLLPSPPMERTVTPGEGTTFFLRTSKDAGAYQKELLAYTQGGVLQETHTSPPLPYEQRTVSQTDITSGDTIEILGSLGEDLSPVQDIRGPKQIIKIVPTASEALPRLQSSH